MRRCGLFAKVVQSTPRKNRIFSLVWVCKIKTINRTIAMLVLKRKCFPRSGFGRSDINERQTFPVLFLICGLIKSTFSEGLLHQKFLAFVQMSGDVFTNTFDWSRVTHLQYITKIDFLTSYSVWKNPEVRWTKECVLVFMYNGENSSRLDKHIEMLWRYHSLTRKGVFK